MPVAPFRLPTRARRGARIAGTVQGLILAATPVSVGRMYLVDQSYTEEATTAIVIATVAALIAAWVVPFILLRASHVGRSGAVAWASWATTVGTAVVVGALVVLIALAGLMLSIAVMWSAPAFDATIVIAAAVAAAVPVVIGACATPAFARTMNRRSARPTQATVAEPPRVELPAIRI